MKQSKQKAGRYGRGKRKDVGKSGKREGYDQTCRQRGKMGKVKEVKER